ncbi:hypothetical protein GCM10022251_74900 [Phytohabitans flavus]
MAAVTVPGSGAAAAAGDTAKIRPELVERFQAKGESDFWIHFKPRADLSQASAVKDWAARGAAVAAALRKTAAQSQAAIRAELDAVGLRYQSFWATNAIKVSGGSQATAQKLAARGEVEGLYAPVTYTQPKLTEGAERATVDAVEWGIANINADAVWSKYGVRGEGITVASIDTGVQFDHPALVSSYRGNNGNGTFSHDYNWFDAAGACGAAPCDLDGHGTHTMGTMAGADGANQIGVAPGAKWIVANGCCPSDEALISSGQWMLEPTDLAGQHPDASKRPNIINNSWGSDSPSNNPFMEDVTLAWAASGIFGVWSNGNSGPGCQTSGSPGSLVSNYSVGAYDAANTVAGFSGRGAGQNGETKPNLSAPGVDVRSSVPGDGYRSANGTSMAAPHLVGAIALLWSAAPTLVGDIAGTRALLDGTAVDQADGSCGGTEGDNNVYGEGRLDALALLDAAPVGDTGILAGTVTDAATGAPVAGATVSVSGPVQRQLTTGGDGKYSSAMLAGDYEVTVATFGYQSRTVTATVTVDTTATVDVALSPIPRVTLSGAVTDGGEHGWPLYAKVSVVGVPGAVDYTTPANGRYSLALPVGTTYTVRVEPQYPGYLPVTKDVTTGTRNVVSNFALPTEAESCTGTPGYGWASDGLYETFDTTATPAGWTVVDHAGTEQVWTFTDDGQHGNRTGGAGGFAVVDSDRYGSTGRQDTSLVSPLIDLTDVAAPVIRFNQDLNWHVVDLSDVDLSTDGGATWTTVLRQQDADVPGPTVTEVPIPQAAGKDKVRVRFHYHEASYAWWWQVDNVLVGTDFSCGPVDGGLVLGHVRDKNTGGYVNGATVVSGDRPAERATSAATPEDPGLEDGFFWMFSSLGGTHEFKATAKQYAADAKPVEVEADGTTAATFQLPAGQLTVQPGTVSGKVRMPTGKVAKTFTVTNTGSAPAQATLVEREGDFQILRADGSRISSAQVLDSAGAPEQRLTVPTSFAARAAQRSAAGPLDAGPQAAPWTDIADYPSATMDNRVVYLDGKVYSIVGGDGFGSSRKNYVYDPVTLSWAPIADLPEARNAMTVGVVDGKIIATGGWAEDGPDGSTWSYDPDGDTWSKLADNPAPRSAAGQAVVDGYLYAVGGCTTSGCVPMSTDVVRYDLATNTWERLAGYPRQIAFASCGGIEGIVYCSGGNDGNSGQKGGFAFDPATGEWSAIADAPADHWASSFAVANGKLVVAGGQQGGAVTNRAFAYDPAGNSWSALPNANTPLYRGGAACGFYKIGGSAGAFNAITAAEVLPTFGDCDDGNVDVGWLSLDKTAFTLAPGEKVTVTATMTATVDQPGTYTAPIKFTEDTPYQAPSFQATMEVQPPSTWAKLSGTVTGAQCGGTSVPLRGATVQVDSWAMSWTFSTDAQGGYAQWIDRRNNPLTLIVAKDGWKPQTRQVRVSTSAPTVEDFTLSPTRC